MALENMFYPGSVAIIGASRERRKLGNIIMRNVLDSGFEGAVYPVNKNAETILGHKVFMNYAELPEVPDLAIVVVPGPFVLEVLEGIGQKGTKNVVVISAGFKETGEEGVTREEQLIEIARKYKQDGKGI